MTDKAEIDERMAFAEAIANDVVPEASDSYADDGEWKAARFLARDTALEAYDRMTADGEANGIGDYRKLTAKMQMRIAKLEGAIMARPPIKPDDGSWWYPEGDTSSDACCHGPSEALESVADGLEQGESQVVVLERALALPDVYAALRVFTDAEMDARGDDEPWDFTLHATHQEAAKALGPD